MKNTALINLGLSLVLGAVIGCGSQNPDRQAPYTEEGFITVQGAQTKTLSDPKVNILIVVDNSQSMDAHQQKLSKNMDQFSEHFFNNVRIDYRIGVVPVYDSKFLNDETVYKSGKRQMNALGQLVPLKGIEAKDGKAPLFITRDTPNAKEILKQTVKIGTQWGPEAEESFSPVLAVMDEKNNAEKNQGFYDKDAYLAIIFLTDAEDATFGLSGSEFYQKIVDLKGGDRSKILIAAALPDTSRARSKECERDGAGPVQSLPELLLASGGIRADLCSNNFGADLAKFGQALVRRVSAQRIPLGFAPDFSTLAVWYDVPGSEFTKEREVLRGKGGYYFDPATNEIVISPDFKFNDKGPRKANSVILAKAKPLNPSGLKTGRLKKVN